VMMARLVICGRQTAAARQHVFPDAAAPPVQLLHGIAARLLPVSCFQHPIVAQAQHRWRRSPHVRAGSSKAAAWRLQLPRPLQRLT
jgi:hypothetical protein